MNLLLILFLASCFAWGVGVLSRVIAEERHWWTRPRPDDEQSWSVPSQQREAA